MKWFLRIAFAILTVLIVLIAITTYRIFNPPRVSRLTVSDLTETEPVQFENLKAVMC
jgi:hypothetical protein